MRPHLALQASIIAFIEASRVTSASNEAASPPSFASFFAIVTVSSAEARSLSTQKTLAPSCTKRMTVARPLPMPVPGPCPAPTTIAILFSRRFIPNSRCDRRLNWRRNRYPQCVSRDQPLPWHGWVGLTGQTGPFSLCSGTHERPFRQEPAAPQPRRRPRDFDPRAARAQFEERRRGDSSRLSRGVHLPVRLGQILTRLRHDLRRGPAAL